MSTIILEPIPDDPLAAEVVVYVRGQLRRQLRHATAGKQRQALALLFGLEPNDERIDDAVSNGTEPMAALADVLADAGGPCRLAHSADTVEAFGGWLKARKDDETAFNEILAHDPATLLALHRAQRLSTAGGSDSRAPAPLLIQGPTGSGKELLARAVHQISGREAFVPVQVAGLPTDAVYSTLFGHEKGAFTGASSPRLGLIAKADGGTLLIDEVGDLPPDAQVALLRFLQDGKYRPLGSDAEKDADVRVIAATWKNLPKLTKDGTFRLDLYHRVAANTVQLPPLRKRRHGLRDLVRELLGRQVPEIVAARSAMDAIVHYGWSGNLRELDAALRVAVDLCDGATVRLEDLPINVQRVYLRASWAVRGPAIVDGDVPGEAATEAVYRSRAGALAARLLAEAPLETDVPLAKILDLLDGFPDAAGLHAQIAAANRKALAAEAEGKQASTVAANLREVADAPELVVAARRAVEQEAASWEKVARECLAEAAGLREAAPLNESGWGRLFAELSGPVGIDSKSVVELMYLARWSATAMHEIAPEEVAAIQQTLAEKGVRGAVGAILRSMAESEVIDVEPEPSGSGEAPLPAGNPRDWTNEEFTTAARGFRKKKDFVAALGVSAETVRRWFIERGIPSPWAKGAAGGTG